MSLADKRSYNTTQLRVIEMFNFKDYPTLSSISLPATACIAA